MSFPRYPKYKPSRVEWLGEVPEHWSAQTFKRQIERNDGGVWGDDPDGLNDTVVLRSTEQTVDGRWQIDDPARRKLNTSEIDSAMLITGDLLLTKSSGSSLHIGKTTLVTKEIASLGCCYSNFMQRIRTKASFTPALAWYVLNNNLARLQFDLLSNSTTGLANLNGTMIGQIIVPVAPIAEQTAIAQFLDRETSKIDALVWEQRRLIELLKEKRQAVISHAVTKGLNPHAPMKPSGIEWLGDVPEHWTIPPIFTRYHAVLGKMLDEKKITGSHLVPYLRNADVNWDRINTMELPLINIEPDEQKRFGLERGDVLICEGGAGIGQTAIWNAELNPCSFQKALHRLRPWRDDEVPRFLYYCMRNAVETGVILAGGTATIPHLTGEQLRRYRFPKPPNEEQESIVQYLDVQTAKLDALTAEAERAIELLQERRTALISAAVTGKIDVRGEINVEAIS